METEKSLQQLIQELCPNGVPYKKLGELGKVFRGTAFQKKDFQNSGFPCIHYGQIYTYYGFSTDKVITYLDKSFAKRENAKYGDLIIATTSENFEDVGKSLVWLGDDSVIVSNDACFFRHTQNPKFVGYLLQTPMFKKFKQTNCSGTKVIRINPDILMDFEVPVPPLAVQEKIVEYLDDFTALTAELQAELQARQQQYEYYRNRLLTFGGSDNIHLTDADDVDRAAHGSADECNMGGGVSV